MHISQIKDIKVNYDVARKEVLGVQIIPESLIKRLEHAAYKLFKSLWNVKSGFAVGALAGITASLILTIPVGLGGIAGATIGAMAQAVIRAIRARIPAFPSAEFQRPPVWISLWKLKEAKRVNQILLKLLDTSWGKQWQEMKNFKLDEAFTASFSKLLGGTCLGQTHTLLKMMSSSHAKQTHELLAEMKKDDIIRYQLVHHMRMSLCRWHNLEIGMKEEDLRDRHAKVNQIHRAQLESFKEEQAFPNAVRKENVVLADKDTKDRSVFGNALKKQLEALKKENPSKLIAGSVVLQLKKGGHAFFVQCGGGHFRLYDINRGMYRYRNQNSLVAGIFHHLKQYDRKGIANAVMETYAITAA